MLDLLRGNASERKLRLMACACCRRIEHLFPDAQCRRPLDVAEKYADGLVSNEVREQEYRKAKEAVESPGLHASQLDHMFYNARLAVYYVARAETWDAATSAAWACVRVCECSKSDGEAAAQAHLLRDIFGNPFRPVTLDPRWLTSSVLDLATGIYEDRAFERMPILADALMDAGCANEDILSHCRGDGPHVRGCWVVDLILGKE